MNNNIYIPKKIRVGYQNRNDTYTQKLGYIIYYDNTGKLRKQTSWENWRNKDIEPEDFNNIPTSGFVLNKHAGGVENSWGWNARLSYIRVYDPRGFEFEITVNNLMYILENTSSIKGKGLDGDFVYGWNGKDLVLIPTDSPDYKDLTEYSTIIDSNEHIKSKDLILGATYIDKENDKYIYMGRYDEYDYGWGGEYDDVKKNMYWFFPCERISKIEDAIGRSYYTDYYIRTEKSISKKFVKCVDNMCTNEYSKIFEFLKTTRRFCPIDYDKTQKYYYSFDEFKGIIESNDNWHCGEFYCDAFEFVRVRHDNYGFYIEDKNWNKLQLYKKSKLNTESPYSAITSYYELVDIYDSICPYVQIQYLQNGYLYCIVGETNKELYNDIKQKYERKYNYEY